MAKAKSPVPEGFHTVTPHLVFDNAAKSIEWYKKALGAKEISRFAGPDGKIMHAELQIGDSRFMANDVMVLASGHRSARFRPPLNLSIEEAAEGIRRMEKALERLA